MYAHSNLQRGSKSGNLIELAPGEGRLPLAIVVGKLDKSGKYVLPHHVQGLA